MERAALPLTSALRILAVAFTLGLGFGTVSAECGDDPTNDRGAGTSEKRPPASPTPPVTEQKPGSGDEKKDSQQDDVQACLQETGDYRTEGRAVAYVIGITNTCDKRLRCEIFANVIGARGSSLGHAVMILGPTSQGAASRKTYAMRVKEAGGIAQVSRDCREY
jgi:hypothetical protein